MARRGLSGSVSYVVEIFDSQNRLLRAYVAKEYPSAENLAPSFGTLAATKAGVREGADNLINQSADKHIPAVRGYAKRHMAGTKVRRGSGHIAKIP